MCSQKSNFKKWKSELTGQSRKKIKDGCVRFMLEIEIYLEMEGLSSLDASALRGISSWLLPAAKCI